MLLSHTYKIETICIQEASILMESSMCPKEKAIPAVFDLIEYT